MSPDEPTNTTPNTTQDTNENGHPKGCNCDLCIIIIDDPINEETESNS